MAKQTATAEKGSENTVSLTAAQNKKIAGLGSVSAQIRYLDSEGYSRSEIARALGKRYQHVRNVLITPVTKPRS